MAQALIARDSELAEVIQALSPMDRLAIDTEFLWERTYYPCLALVQVAGQDPQGQVHAWAIDALSVDLAPLQRFLAEPQRLKIVHAGRIDLQIFNQLGTHLEPVFDSQQAASLLGFGHQIGYAALVENLTGVRLAKAEQYSDWTRRPLTEAQVEYALMDVVHLLHVHKALVSLLVQTGREAWAQEEMRSLNDPETYVEPPPEERYLKVKARRGLDRRSLAILRELAAWREREAEKRDLRPGLIVKDVALLGLARSKPGSLSALRNARGLHEREVRRSGDAILAAIRAGQATDDLPEAGDSRRRKRVDVGGAVDLIKAYLALRAAQVDVAGEILATTRAVEQLAKAHARGEEIGGQPLLCGWRGELAGRDVLRILRGEVSLGLDPKTAELRLVARDEDS